MAEDYANRHAIKNAAYTRDYNEKLSEKWTEHELNQKIEDAGKVRHRYPKGHLLQRNRIQKRPKAIPAAAIVVWKIERITPVTMPSVAPPTGTIHITPTLPNKFLQQQTNPVTKPQT